MPITTRCDSVKYDCYDLPSGVVLIAFGQRLQSGRSELTRRRTIKESESRLCDVSDIILLSFIIIHNWKERKYLHLASVKVVDIVKGKKSLYWTTSVTINSNRCRSVFSRVHPSRSSITVNTLGLWPWVTRVMMTDERNNKHTRKLANAEMTYENSPKEKPK